ncbi:MAG: HAD-IA family hydrolase [Chloroflexi bacterium]|nr:HAD-IA family hydrolase [Chloroflexota bacterium]
MIQTLIFDLSEVIISGLVGIELPLSKKLQLPAEKILAAFGGTPLQALCCGELTEDEYLRQVLLAQQWSLSPVELKQVIRQNFHEQIPGTVPLLETLAGHYELVLLSDHAREWVEYIRAVHTLAMFKFIFFSYEIGQTKRTPSTFQKVLKQIGRRPEACLFIDDSLTNIKAAEAAGITGIQFESAAQLRQALAQRSIQVA